MYIWMYLNISAASFFTDLLSVRMMGFLIASCTELHCHSTEKFYKQEFQYNETKQAGFNTCCNKFNCQILPCCSNFAKKTA